MSTTPHTCVGSINSILILGKDYNYTSPYTVDVELILFFEIHCYNIPLIPNDVVEPDKTISLQLDFIYPVGFNFPLHPVATLVTIVNDDSKSVPMHVYPCVP